MKCSAREHCPIAFILRWMARSIALVTIAFLVWMLLAHVAVGEGPNPFHMSPTELGLSIALLAAVAGMAIGWRRELAGGLLIVGAMAVFFAIEFTVHGSLPRGWVVWVLPVPGVLYLLAVGLESNRPRQLRTS